MSSCELPRDTQVEERHDSLRITREEVHEALESLYDGLALGQVALAGRLPEVAAMVTPAERARKLRALLRDAIEVLQPSRPASFRSPATRSYDVMTLRYVKGLPMSQVAEELDISERQAYRDLLRAEESLAGFLAASLARPGAPPWREDALGEELQGLSAQSTPVDLAILLDEAVRTVDPLARRLGGRIDLTLPEYSLAVVGDQALVRLTLVKMLSAALRLARDGRLHVGAQAMTEEVHLELHYTASEPALPHTFFADVESLARAQRMVWDLACARDGQVSARLTLPRRRRRLVLVLEDNESTVELYRRFLATDDEWELCAMPDARTLLEQARNRRPAVVVLDVLMPHCDGWQVLQTLRAQPETCNLPILVCSVFDDEDLSRALGADVCLKKPVSQDQFLKALRACLERHSQPAQPPAPPK